MKSGDIISAVVVSNNKVGFIVVEIEGQFYRVYRKYLPEEHLAIGSIIQLEVTNMMDGYGKPIMTVVNKTK